MAAHYCAWRDCHTAAVAHHIAANRANHSNRAAPSGDIASHRSLNPNILRYRRNTPRLGMAGRHNQHILILGMRSARNEQQADQQQ